MMCTPSDQSPPSLDEFREEAIREVREAAREVFRRYFEGGPPASVELERRPVRRNPTPFLPGLARGGGRVP